METSDCTLREYFQALDGHYGYTGAHRTQSARMAAWDDAITEEYRRVRDSRDAFEVRESTRTAKLDAIDALLARIAA